METIGNMEKATDPERLHNRKKFHCNFNSYRFFTFPCKKSLIISINQILTFILVFISSANFYHIKNEIRLFLKANSFLSLQNIHPVHNNIPVLPAPNVSIFKIHNYSRPYGKKVHRHSYHKSSYTLKIQK